MRRFLKYLRNTILSILGLLLFYVLVGFGLSRIPVAKQTGLAEDVTIYIRTNGVHTDLVLPATHALMNWTSLLPYAHTRLRDSSQFSWVAMGWGDKGFYLETPTWADLKASTAFKAAFGLSTTAMHTTYYRSPQESATCKKIMLSSQQYQQLIQYLLESFITNDQGLPIPVNTTVRYNNADAFYEANGHYSLFKTCNSWANAALKACGQKACYWTALDSGIFRQYEN